MAGWLRRAWPYLLAVAGLYLAWKLAAVWLGSVVLPRPEDAAAEFVRALGRRRFWDHFAASALRSIAAMGLAWGVGFPLGVLMGASSRVDRVLSPLVALTYPIPKIVLLPVAFLLLGLGEASKVAMIALILGYQVLVTTRDAVKNIPSQYLDSVRSLGATRLQRLTEAVLPAAMPGGFTALRLNSGVSVAVLFFVESFATQRGLGYMIMDAWGRMAFEEMFSGIFGMSLLGVLLYESVSVLERRVCAWKYCART